MASGLRAIGIDPGPTPGIVALDFPVIGPMSFEIVQCTSGLAATIVGMLMGSSSIRQALVVQAEQFVVGRRAGRSSTASAGAETRDMVGELQATCADYGQKLLVKAAGNVKPWATDDRLEAAGLLAATKGMRHARDAARHALFAAVHDGGIPDPLSKAWSY